MAIQTLPATSPADASAAFGANRPASQPEAASDARRFAELLQQRREAQPQATAQAKSNPTLSPKSETPARPNAPAPRKAADSAGDKEEGTRSGADASRATSTARAATGSNAADKNATEVDPHDPPSADAPLPATDPLLAGGAPPVDDAAGSIEDRATRAEAAPAAPGADPAFWPGMPMAVAQDALPAAGSAALELRTGAGGANAAPGIAGHPAGGPTLTAGGGGNAASHDGGGEGSGDARGDAAAEHAAALIAAAATDSKIPAAAGAAADRFTLAARAAEAALPPWAAGAAPHRVEGNAAASIALPTPLAAPDFAKALGAQVSLFARNSLAQAELQLTPAEMGPIRVQIAIDGAHARVDFAADSAATRQVIERGLPELASALREQGLTLSGGGVFQRAPDKNNEQTDAQAAPGRARRRATTRATDAVEPSARSRASSSRPGGVDLYA